MSEKWSREDQPERATDRILDAAEKAFGELGVARTRVATVAEYAGCSRATLYRYFRSLDAIHLAYINRSALRIVGDMAPRLAAIEDPTQRFVEGIVYSLQAVRRHPGMLAWFEPETSGLAARLSRSSAVVDALTSAFVAELLPTAPSGPRGPRAEQPAEAAMWARWLVRVIISFLSMPGESASDERAQIERFAAPVIREIITGEIP